MFSKNVNILNGDNINPHLNLSTIGKLALSRSGMMPIYRFWARMLIFVVAPCAFPASIPLILGIGTGAVQGGYQKTRLGASFSIGNRCCGDADLS